MKYILDEEGNVFRAQVVSGIPSGFTDISKDLDIDEDAKELSSQFVEAELIAEVPAVEEVAEHWTNGEDTVYNANDIPTLIDGNGDPYLDPDYVRVEAVEAAEAIPAHYRIKKTSTADQEIRQVKMNKLSSLRASLLTEADIEINKLMDTASDTSLWRTYRQNLRDITEPYKKVDGDWKATVDSLDIESFTWPSKPGA